MPRYEFRCQDCIEAGSPATFEVSRPMSAAGEPATCPSGHRNTVKLLSTVSVGRGSLAGAAPAGGGCCGGACGCG